MYCYEKSFTFVLAILGFAVASFAQISLKTASGWLETAFAEWETDGADSFNVYYSGNGLANVKVDAELVRKYGSKYRVDILGLVPSEYTIKIVSVKNGEEGIFAETEPLKVLAHDRAGFAFSNNRVPGAYKIDGSLKDNAVVVYVSEKNKNTVSLNVATSSKDSTKCTGLQNILLAFKKGYDLRPLDVRVIGNVTDFAEMDKGDLLVDLGKKESSFVTIEGVGNDATANGWGVRIKNSQNVEVRNLGFMNVDSDEGDNVGLQQDNQYIWVHNCDFFYGDAGSDADQVKGDGALDCKKSTYVTFSYNHFWDNGKSNLLGLSENTVDGLYITYHHNWYDHSDSRHPRVRFYSAHVYNNYYDGNAKYGIGATNGSSVFSEANFFRNCKYPMMISMQGSDVYAGKNLRDVDKNPTFSKEDGGIIKSFNNHMEGSFTFIPYNGAGFGDINTSADFDAYVVESRDDKVPLDVRSFVGGNSYNNFDVDRSIMYSYMVDTPENARMNVVHYAGRCEGGDFKWKFDNSVDDASYAVNQKLKDALVAYKGGSGEVSAYDLDFLNDSSVVDSSSEGTSSQDSVVAEMGKDSLDSSLDVAIDSMVLVKNDSLVDSPKDSLESSMMSKDFDVPTDVRFRYWVWESRLQIEADDVLQVSVADANGRFVMAGQMEKTSVGTSLDLRGLRRGAYAIVVKTLHGIYRRKIVVK